jgi:lipopolysaccharide/colanic/teichoic acid biosynthesis glycosyltransferase
MSAAPAPRRETELRWPVDDSKGAQLRGPAKEHDNIALLDSPAVPVSIPAPPAETSGLQAIWQYAYRLIEIAIAAGGLILTFPVALIIALIIKRDSPGPAVFRQRRVAQNGKIFAFYKFRTLYVDAKQRWPELYAYQYTRQDIETKPFKNEDDPRVTKVGKWLRRTTLDEIPNLYNLLRGDVTMVGPRPEIPEMLPYYSQEEMIKFSVKPGLTGLAQTTGRNRLTIKQTIEWDVYYVRNRTLRLDISILLRTIKRVIARDGAL